MNRRHFISGLAALLGGVALEQAIPLGRVWSFPSVIKPAKIGTVVNFRFPQQFIVRGVFPPHLLVNQSEGELLTLRVTDAYTFDVGQTIQLA